MKILITGAAGFVGYHLCLHLLKSNNKIFGIDNINDSYDTNLKKIRLKNLKEKKEFIFYKLNINNKNKIKKIVKENNIKYIINLAAQAGVRESAHNPRVYHENNVKGFFNILEIAKENKVKHLMFASSSSVYGDLSKMPWKENYNTDYPKSFYAASKKINEIMAYSYANTFNIPITCLRFFTIYGPLGRPDMAIFKFIDNIYKKKQNQVYNFSNHSRDFTYIDDVINAISKLLKKHPKTATPYQCFNIANGKRTKLSYLIKVIKNNINLKSTFVNIKKNPYDVKDTWADTKRLKNKIGPSKKTNIEEGIIKFINWYDEYFNDKTK